ncbi:MAG: amidohydrolase family protein [Saccharofermentanales bacterium]
MEAIKQNRFNENDRYEMVDMPFYREVISPLLPARLLDFHTHSWKRDQWIASVSKYMSTELEYDMDTLISDVDFIFPGQQNQIVVFGQPTPSADMGKTNKYIEDNSHRENIYPLIITGKNLIEKSILKQKILDKGFYGYKVFLNWSGNDYGILTVDEMIGDDEMELANELGLVVLLHVPRSGRLADPVISQGVRNLSLNYPGAKIVLAHCGRCYRSEEINKAISSISDLSNVYLDTAMVMDPTVLHIIFNTLDSSRVLYATDFPIAAMRGRRVNVMDHWVDVVLEGYPESEFRVSSNNIRATFMAYEIVLAIKTAADTAGLRKDQFQNIFFNNGMELLCKNKQII